MFNLGTEKSMAIIQLTIILLTNIHHTNAFDQCDVRGRMTVSKGNFIYPKNKVCRVSINNISNDKLIDFSYHIIHSFLECKNKHSDSKCEQYARLGYCTGQTYENMFIQCKRSCGFCSE